MDRLTRRSAPSGAHEQGPAAIGLVGLAANEASLHRCGDEAGGARLVELEKLHDHGHRHWRAGLLGRLDDVEHPVRPVFALPGLHGQREAHLAATDPHHRDFDGLEHADRLIEAGFDEALAAEGLARRHWQVLNVLASQPRGLAELDAALAPFGGVQDAAGGLLERGWIAWRDDTFELTLAGQAAWERIGAHVQAMRARVAEGIAPEEYETTIRTLRHMAGNLTR